MKRKHAIEKIRKICQRLDQIDSDFPVVPFHLYVFGSVLYDKPNPRDLDLLLHATLIEEFEEEMAWALADGTRRSALQYGHWLIPRLQAGSWKEQRQRLIGTLSNLHRYDLTLRES